MSLNAGDSRLRGNDGGELKSRAHGWAVYEDGGELSVLRIERVNESTFRLEGGRKVARQRAWLVLPEYGKGVAKQAQELAENVDINQLRELTNGEEKSAEELTALAQDNNIITAAQDAREYSQSVWLLGVLRAALANPAHFHRGRGKLRPAGDAALKSALADIEQKRATSEKRAALIKQLRDGEMPAEVAKMRDNILLGSAKNSAAHGAVQKMAGSAPDAIARFFEQRGLLKGARDYWRVMFNAAWPPDSGDEGIADAPKLPAAKCKAPFSIDDAGTFEVDDAFSAEDCGGGKWRIGIHIAAPALGITGGGAADQAAFAKMTSVYFPDCKRPMLPPAALEKYSLQVNKAAPALSIYFDFDRDAATYIEGATVLETITTKAAFVPEQMEEELPEDIAAQYSALCDFVKTLPPLNAQRNEARDRLAYFNVEALEVSMRPRAPSSYIVEALMRLVNGLWAKRLAQSGAGLFRKDGATKQCPQPDDEDYYAWMSSPLRRYADLKNQRLLLSLLYDYGGSGDCEKTNWKKLASLFDARYARAKYHQKIVERHYALSALQKAEGELEGEVDFDNKKRRIRLKDYPLIGKVRAKDAAASAHLSRLTRIAKQNGTGRVGGVFVRAARVDLYKQLALFDLIPPRK